MQTEVQARKFVYGQGGGWNLTYPIVAQITPLLSPGPRADFSELGDAKFITIYPVVIEKQLFWFSAFCVQNFV